MRAQQLNTKSPERVSILMNCFNGELYLKEALESVLEQTYQNWELIFWDNVSTDKSAEIFKSYKDERFKYYLSEKHTDLGLAREQASEYLNGEYIAILDADDIWFKDKLQSQVEKFRDKDISVVISNTRYFSKTVEKILYKTKYNVNGDNQSRLLMNYDISLETVMIRRSCIENKIFDSEYSHIADFELIMRALEAGKLGYCDAVLAKWRIHEKNNSWLFPSKFNCEKRKWIKKKSLESSYLSKYKYEIDFFNNKINCSRILNLCSNKKYQFKYKLLGNLNYKFIMSWLVLMVCISPVRRLIIRYRTNKKYLLNGY